MNWDAIGAIGEIIGALAVFLTLIYLSMQIRQNTRAVQASAVDSAINQVNHIRDAVFTDPEVTSMFRRGNEDPESLSEEDKIRYRLLLHNALLAEANCHSQTVFTGLPISTWETQLPIVIRLVSSTGGLWFWKHHRMEFEESFRTIVDKELSKISS
jgi:hypothetical protein